MSVTYIDAIPGFDEADSRLAVCTCGDVAFVRAACCLLRIELAEGRIAWLIERPYYENEATGAELSRQIRFWGKELWVNREGTVVAELVTGETGNLVVVARSAVDGRSLWTLPIAVTDPATVFFAADPDRLVICLFRESRRYATESEGFEPPPYTCQTDAFRLHELTGEILWNASCPGLRIGSLQAGSFTGLWSHDSLLGKLDLETGANRILFEAASTLGDPISCTGGLAVSWHSRKEIGIEWFDESGKLIRSSRIPQTKVQTTRLRNTEAGLALQANDAAMLWWYGREDRPIWSVRARPYIYQVYGSAGTDIFVGTDGMGGRLFGFDSRSGRETLNLKPALGGVGSLSPIHEHPLLVASFRTSKSYSRAPSLLILNMLDRSHRLAYECQVLQATWAHGAICRAGERSERLAIIDLRESQDKVRLERSPGAIDQAELPLPAVGSVYMFELPDGQYGACRVLRHLPPRRSRDVHCRAACAVVAATAWIGKAVPDLNEPQLRQVLVLSHHSWAGQQQIRMIAGQPGRGQTFIGTIEPNPEELRIESVHCGQSWRDCTRFWGHQLLLQWQWDTKDRSEHAPHADATE